MESLVSLHDIQYVYFIFGIELMAHCPGLLQQSADKDNTCVECATPCKSSSCDQDTPCRQVECPMARTDRLNKLLVHWKLELLLGSLTKYSSDINLRLYGRKIQAAFDVATLKDGSLLINGVSCMCFCINLFLV